MARINEEDIDTLRERADIVEIISAHSQLKRSGGQTFKGLCPFHSEKTPSFTVDAARGLYYCFGCGEGGNLYHFVEKMEHLPFPEAVEWVARKTGFQLRYEEMRPGDVRASGLKARILEANETATKFFHKTLMESPDALASRRYLEGRGFDAGVAERWRLGYAPGRDSLCRHLLSKGFTEDEIRQAYLGQRSDRDGALFDTFRQRIIFPTWSLHGDVVAFGARALGDQQPKYLNTSDTPVFSKSRVMYGLDRAKSAISRGAALIVEGYTDVIALHEAGVTEAVATNGVALGESHFELLKKFSSRVVLMFDADEAGKGATERSFGVHHRIGLDVLVAPLPSGRDPADVVREDGSEGIKKVVEAAQPLMEFKLEEMISKLALDTPESRSRAVSEVVKVLGFHPDPIARHQYTYLAARRIGVDPEMIQRALQEERQDASGAMGRGAERERDRRLPGHVKVEREALRLLLTRTQETASWAREIGDAEFTSAARRELFRHGLTAAEAGRSEVGPEVTNQLTPEALSLYSELTIGAGDSAQADIAVQGREIFTRLRVFSLEREIKNRRNTLQEVNPLVDADKHDQLFTELIGLEAQRRDLIDRLRVGAA